MNVAKAFLDTNILVYLYSPAEAEKQRIVIKSINRYDCFISMQVLNEFCNVCTRKLKMPTNEIRATITKILKICYLMEVDKETADNALEIHERYGYTYYDSLMVSSALESDCEYLLTEDLSDGQIIDGKLTIKNIFKEQEQ
jgi:predicted nucleic acid-binding protein